MDKQVSSTGLDIRGFENIISYLKSHNTGADKDIATVQSFLMSEPEENQEFYKQIITKSLRLGCNSKVINKIIPNLIPSFEVMLGTPIEKCKLKEGAWISLSRKLNGCRAAFVGNKILTRQGKEYVGLSHIVEDLQAMGYSDMFVDGELLYKNEEGLSDSEAFQKGTGIAMSKSEDKSQLKFVVFDLFPLDEFWEGKSKEAYLARNNKYLMKLSARISEYNTQNIETVPIVYEGFDQSQIWRWLDFAEKNDWEGIMINLDTPYECKRTKNLIKVKKFFTCDIFCVGLDEGSGRNSGTLGAAICDYKGNTLKVGSGFTDSDREYFWSHPEDIVGHIISVKYKEETKNKDGGISVQFPVYESVRLDKSLPSYY